VREPRGADHRVRYEVIRGELFVTPAPGLAHQRTVVELTTLLGGYVGPEYSIFDVDARHVERWTPGALAPDVLTERLVWRDPGAPALEIDLAPLFARVWR
jgi:Uma2 family endonuclease